MSNVSNKEALANLVNISRTRIKVNSNSNINGILLLTMITTLQFFRFYCYAYHQKRTMLTKMLYLMIHRGYAGGDVAENIQSLR